MIYHRIAVVVMAVQWDGRNYVELPDWVKDACHGILPHPYGMSRLLLDTAHGLANVTSGQWIVKSTEGIYPCTDEAFKAQYRWMEV